MRPKKFYGNTNEGDYYFEAERAYCKEGKITNIILSPCHHKLQICSPLML